MSLKNELKQHIAANGPITMATYMEQCLSHPEYGYYATKDPFGKKGDFTTAPEISQLFGEMIGIWLAHQWLNDGAPSPFSIIELGPGRGTLMSDILRATKHVPGFHQHASINLIETSPTLTKKQQEALKEHHNISWHHTIDNALEPKITYIIANEFFDALPMSQYVYRQDQWHEVCIGIANDELALVEQPSSITPDVQSLPKEGDIYEYSDLTTSIMEEIADHIAGVGGSFLTIDYGYDTPAFGDTVQAMANHAYQPILYNPGNADITAHVNFDRLRKIALNKGTNTHGVTTQASLLKALGIHMRASVLKQTATKKQADEIDAALTRLLDDDAMGRLFKCLAITHPETSTPAGFE